ncbi:MAG: DegT/DnrJ/EryC1/StrS aminotransferase family protein [Spirochaetes bacterium]|nr:DegT/DnrJ/EryC1/StrS aminotransferase family protein [Spirochaetota bacterium]
MSIVSGKPTITRKELEGVLDCLINEELISGGITRTFEKNLCELTSFKFCTAVNSLTAAYHLAFHALGINRDSEIIIPSYFNSAPLNALEIIGAKAVFVDIQEDNLLPDFDEIKRKCNENTKAIVTGHVSGIVDSFEALKQTGIPVIEDISHAIGTEIEGKHIGLDASITVCAFTPYDMITTGNGAALFTNNTKFYSTFKTFRYSSDSPSFDYTMTDFQGAMGISQLSRIQNFIRRRREIAQIYYDRLRMTQHHALYPFNPVFTYQAFPLIFDSSAEKTEKFFKKAGIEIYHPVETPLHIMKGFAPMDFPRSDRMSKKLYSLPIYPTLTKNEIEKISRNIAKFI